MQLKIFKIGARLFLLGTIGYLAGIILSSIVLAICSSALMSIGGSMIYFTSEPKE